MMTDGGHGTAMWSACGLAVMLAATALAACGGDGSGASDADTSTPDPGPAADDEVTDSGQVDEGIDAPVDTAVVPSPEVEETDSDEADGDPCEEEEPFFEELYADDPSTTVRECELSSSVCDVPAGWDYYLSRDFCMDPVCGDFELTAVDWFWAEGSEDTFIHILLEADGPLDCYFFGGFDDCSGLTMSWDEGFHLDKPLDPGRLFGCDDICAFGDIFATSEVWHADPDDATLQELVDQFGLPDEACGRVCNRDGFEHAHCAPLGGRPICGDGNSIPESATTDARPLSCAAMGTELAFEVVLAARPGAALEAGDNDFDLTWAITVDGETTSWFHALADSAPVSYMAGGVNVEVGASELDGASIALQGQCVLDLETDTATQVVLPVSSETWELEGGDTLSLTLTWLQIQFDDPLEIMFETADAEAGPDDPGFAPCVWPEGPPELRFSRSE